MRKVLAWTGVIAVLTGVAWYISWQVKLAKELSYSFKNLKIHRISKTNLEMSMDMSIHNKTELEVQLRGLDIDVYINNVFVTKAESNYITDLRPNDTAQMPVRLKIDPSHVFDNITDIAFGSSTIQGIEFKLKGKVRVKKLGLPLLIPFEYESTLGKFM